MDNPRKEVSTQNKLKYFRGTKKQAKHVLVAMVDHQKMLIRGYPSYELFLCTIPSCYFGVGGE